jgi:hypothetical protein
MTEPLRIQHTTPGMAVLWRGTELFGWATLTRTDGRLTWSVSPLNSPGRRTPDIRDASAEAAVEAWTQWEATR